jgi:hypothetical protein
MDTTSLPDQSNVEDFRRKMNDKLVKLYQHFKSGLRLNEEAIENYFLLLGYKNHYNAIQLHYDIIITKNSTMKLTTTTLRLKNLLAFQT